MNIDAPDTVPRVRRPGDDIDAARPVAPAVDHGVREELVPGGGWLRPERSDDRRAGGTVLDRHPHARALPRLGDNLFLGFVFSPRSGICVSCVCLSVCVCVLFYFSSCVFSVCATLPTYHMYMLLIV